MAKRANTAKNSRKKKNTSALAKAAKNVPGYPMVASAAAAIPATAIMLAVGACAVGALAFILLSGTAGQRRREMIRAKALQAGETISKGGREVRERLGSVAAQATKRVRGELSDGMANGVGDERTGEPAMNI
jgi:hypothetical protein